MKRMIAVGRASFELTTARMSSSNRKGAAKAIENGQPRTPPTANQIMPWAVLSPPRQLINAAMPSMVVYMAKLEGRKAVEARNMPGEKIMDMRKNMAMRGLRVMDMTRKSCVWAMAQKMART